MKEINPSSAKMSNADFHRPHGRAWPSTTASLTPDDPAIPIRRAWCVPKRDARVKPAHDEMRQLSPPPQRGRPNAASAVAEMLRQLQALRLIVRADALTIERVR